MPGRYTTFKRDRRRPRRPCWLRPRTIVFAVAVVDQIAYILHYRESLRGMTGTEEPDELRRINDQLLTSGRARRMVHYWVDAMEWNESHTASRSLDAAGKRSIESIEPLGIPNRRNDSYYESTRSYWNDPTWSRQDSYPFYPTCNTVHEMDLLDLQAFELIRSDGSIRLSILYHPQETHLGQAHLRMMHTTQPITRASMVMAMTDSTAMERVQASPWIVSVYQACGLSMFSELMKGGTLTTRLMVRPSGRRVKYFPMERLRYALQVSRALADIHAAQVAHLDIQPKNIMLDKDDGNGQIYLNDFNLARLSDTRTARVTNTSMETNFHQDMRQLGKLLYTIRTGRLLNKDLNGFWKDTGQSTTANEQNNNTTTSHWNVRLRQLNFSNLEEGKTSHKATLALSTLEWAISTCLQPVDPANRPTSQQLWRGFESVYEEIRNHANTRSLADIRQRFESGLQSLQHS